MSDSFFLKAGHDDDDDDDDRVVGPGTNQAQFHSVPHKENKIQNLRFCLIRCYTTWSDRSTVTFQKTLLPPIAA